MPRRKPFSNKQKKQQLQQKRQRKKDRGIITAVASFFGYLLLNLLYFQSLKCFFIAIYSTLILWKKNYFKLLGTSTPEKEEESHSSTSGEDVDVQDGDPEQQTPVEGELPGGAGYGDGRGLGRPAVDVLNQQPMLVTRGGIVGHGRHDPNRYRLHFESESKEEIEKRKRMAKSAPIVPLPDVSSTH